MKNLKTYFKHIGSTLMIAMSADGYRRTLINDNKNRETDRIIQETIRRSTELSNKLNEQIEQNIINNSEIENNLNNIKTGLESIQDKVNNLNKLELEEVNNKTDLINESFKTLTNESSKVNNIIDKVLDFINKSTPPSSNNNLTFQNILDQYYQYFDSLTTIQKGALAHILFCIGLLFCIFDILLAYYSDKIIIYFKLETKYPKLAKYIQLRRKFQNYYIKFNFILIIVLVLFVLCENILILLDTL
jgi:hypothetical protein